MALIKCPECGKEISDKAERCPKCGYLLRKNEMSDIEEHGVTRRPQMKKTVIIIICSVIMLVIVVGVGISQFVFNKKEKDTEVPKLHNIPTELSYLVGEQVDFDNVLKESGVVVTDNKDDDLKIKVNDSNVKFDIPGEYKLIVSAKDHAKNKVKKEITIHVNDTETHKAYTAATTLKKEALSQTDSGSYKYDGIHVIDSELNSLESGTMYRSIAKQLEGFYLFGNSLYENWNANIAQVVFGIDKPSTYDEMKPYVDEVFKFITPNSTLPQILSWIQTSSCVQGNFDYEKAQFSFEITDLSKAASEMHITEKMLGYVLATIDEYAPESSFQGNTYSCQLQVVGDAAKTDKNIITEEDMNSSMDGVFSPGTTENMRDTLNSLGKGAYRWAFFDKNVDVYKEGVIATSRDIRIGMSYNSVIYKYGTGKEGNTIFSDDDMIYEVLNEAYVYDQDDAINFYKEQAKKYMAYQTADNQYELIFVFDENNNVSWIIYDNKPAYN